MRVKPNEVVVGHFCNNPLSCPECIRKFYKWAQSHTYGKKDAEGPHFYDHVRFKPREVW